MGKDIGAYKYQMEAGYKIWTFQGRMLVEQGKEKLYSICWRPHPPSLLSAQKRKEIKKKIKTYQARYNEIDNQAKDAAKKAFEEERKRKSQAFQIVLDRIKE